MRVAAGDLAWRFRFRQGELVYGQKVLFLYLICLYYFRVIVGWTAGKPPLAAATCILFATRFPSGLREEVIVPVMVTHPESHSTEWLGWGLMVVLSGIAVVFAFYAVVNGIDVTGLGDVNFAA